MKHFELQLGFLPQIPQQLPFIISLIPEYLQRRPGIQLGKLGQMRPQMLYKIGQLLLIILNIIGDIIHQLKYSILLFLRLQQQSHRRPIIPTNVVQIRPHIIQVTPDIDQSLQIQLITHQEVLYEPYHYDGELPDVFDGAFAKAEDLDFVVGGELGQ
jgi:hypothetical protein